MEGQIESRKSERAKEGQRDSGNVRESQGRPERFRESQRKSEKVRERVKEKALQSFWSLEVSPFKIPIFSAIFWEFFCSISKNYLLGSRQNLLQNTDDAMNEDVSPDVATRIARFKIIRNRWNLAFTLIRNPGLVGLRRSGENSDKDASCESVFATRSAQQLQNLGRKVEMV